jgi:hypothetical protein
LVKTPFEEVSFCSVLTHHAGAAYDDKTVVISGTVKQFHFTFFYSWIQVAVKGNSFMAAKFEGGSAVSKWEKLSGVASRIISRTRMPSGSNPKR